MFACYRCWIPTVLLVAISACQSPPQTTAPLDDSVVAVIDSVLGGYAAPGSPGAAVMVLREGEVEFAKGYGFTDSAGTVPLTRSTPFRLGSVSKQFTAMAVMILAERGQLDYDAPAMDIVPEIARFGPGITIRNLLTHTSGIPDYYAVLEERIDSVRSVDDDPLYTTVDAVATYLDWGEPVAAPGERYEYSNPAYELLALIVERVSGQTFRAFLAQNVFEPAGMITADVRDRPDVVIPGRAIGYAREGTGWKEDDDHPLNWIVGAGGVYASLDDMGMWDRALASNRVASAVTQREAWSPFVLNDGTLSWYGFGWRLAEDGQTVGHGGSWVGFRTRIERSIDTGVSVIVLTNSSAPGAEISAVVDAVITNTTRSAHPPNHEAVVP